MKSRFAIKDADEEVMISSPPRTPPARLPEHFATAYEYSGDNSSGFTLILPYATPDSSTSSSTSQIEPRRSPRKRQERVPNLQAFDVEEEDDEAYEPSKTAQTSPKKLSRRSKIAEGSEEESPTKKVKSRKRIKRTRDDPNSASGSIYAHLKGLPDLFAEHNDIMFCGINPGVKSSSSGHHFAHRSNHFYPSLHLAGITEQRMKPEQDVDFPFLHPFSLGLTNLAGRPTAEGSELLPSELIAGVPRLLEKVQRWKPKTVCFVGKGISEAFMKGLKQAGAIDKGSSGKGKRSTASKPTRGEVSEPGPSVKVEESVPSLANTSELEGATRADRTTVKASVPSSVLRAYPPASRENEDDTKPKDGTASPSKAPSSPQKGNKPLYTKGNSKDDTGYGLLPICVAHSSRGREQPLRIEDVTLFFVTPSSSARVTTHFLDDKARILSSLRVLVQHLQPAQTSANVTASQGDQPASQQVKAEPDSFLSESPAMDAVDTVDLEVVDVSRFDIDTS